jgi:SM-20-related protein
MTPKQLLDSFSETLMQDERILSPQEHTLLSTLLQHAKAKADSNRETQRAVRDVIASAVGETVAQRAFAVLGGSIVERILKGSPATDFRINRNAEFAMDTTPQEPDPPRPMGEPDPPVTPKPSEPDPPGVTNPGEPDPPLSRPRTEPDPPVPHARAALVSEPVVAVALRPVVLPAKCVVLDEFLAPHELAELTRFTLEHEADFITSEVVSPKSESGVIDYEHRRSRVLMDLAHHQGVLLQRIKAVLPQVLDKLEMKSFAIADVEAQITASNDGDFFHFHSDNTNPRVASRYLTFVYFFHREPRQFEGGELRIHDARLKDGVYASEGSYQTISPQQNQIVFFPCELLHEITAVNCPSRIFADSRFTLNGWLRR